MKSLPLNIKILIPLLIILGFNFNLNSQTEDIDFNTCENKLLQIFVDSLISISSNYNKNTFMDIKNNDVDFSNGIFPFYSNSSDSSCYLVVLKISEPNILFTIDYFYDNYIAKESNKYNEYDTNINLILSELKSINELPSEKFYLRFKVRHIFDVLEDFDFCIEKRVWYLDIELYVPGKFIKYYTLNRGRFWKRDEYIKVE